MTTDPSLLSEKELRDYQGAMKDHGLLLRAAASAAMDLADQVIATHELRKNALTAGKKQEKVLARILKARGRTIEDVKDVDIERGAIVWK